MNDFTKNELEHIADAILYSQMMESRADILVPIREKIKLMIKNYSPFNEYKIAHSHLKEAESLIGHAMSLLEMRDE